MLLSEQCYAYAMKALASHSLQNKNNSIQLFPNQNIIVVKLCEIVLATNKKVTPSLLITALSACRDMDDWRSALQVYELAKISLKNGLLVNNFRNNTPAGGGDEVLQRLPSIIYGQTIVTLARGGVEAQTFQVVCEMLEAGMLPAPLTVDLMFLELSKGGAYKSMLVIMEQLLRYRIRISTMALD
jgi:hypothetical protein